MRIAFVALAAVLSATALGCLCASLELLELACYCQAAAAAGLVLYLAAQADAQHRATTAKEASRKANIQANVAEAATTQALKDGLLTSDREQIDTAYGARTSPSDPDTPATQREMNQALAQPEAVNGQVVVPANGKS